MAGALLAAALADHRRGRALAAATAGARCWRQPGHPAGPAAAWSLPPLLAAREPAAYLWSPGAWWRHDADPGINAHNNALATRFALAAIRAQPAAYLRTVASGIMLTFLATDRSLTARTLHFTPVPDVAALGATQVRHLRGYARVTSDTHPVQPYAYFVYLYQQPVYFPGIVFALVLAAGLAGVIRARRWRGHPVALPWAVAVIGIVAPVALHEYHYRYAITVVPVACLAAWPSRGTAPGAARSRRRPRPGRRWTPPWPPPAPGPRPRPRRRSPVPGGPDVSGPDPVAGFGVVSRVAAAWSAVGRHRLFAVAFGLGLAVRVITMLGFPPAIWFGGDSASYLSTALYHAPGTSRLSGYGIVLFLLSPFHSFAAVTAVQHLAGLAAGVMIYALLRRYGLPAWGATLAALPVLLDAYQIELEHEILPSATFGFLVMLAITLTLWWRGGRPLWATVAAGFVLAAGATLWPVGLPVFIVFLLYLVLRRVGWRAFGATAVAGAIPLAGYVLWFHSVYGVSAFSNSDGIYLWSRTMTFANCAVIKPPADELALCPRQPVGQRPSASTFIWEKNSPLNGVPGQKFSVHKNKLAMNFALRAITAQPGGYLRDVLHDASLTFYWNNPDHPSLAMTRRYQFAYATTHWIAPGFVLGHGHTVAFDQLRYGGQTSTRAVEPFAGWMRGYQRFVYLRGTLLGVLLLIGLGGIVRSWRGGGFRRLDGWGGPGLFPWVASVTLLLVPVMTADFAQRYVLIGVPVICLAAGLAFARRDPGAPQAQVQAPAPEAVPATGPATTTATGPATPPGG